MKLKSARESPSPIGGNDALAVFAAPSKHPPGGTQGKNGRAIATPAQPGFLRAR
jgi:hypothetical protein